MKTNTKAPSIYTHEGGKAKHINAEQELRRSLMACMLWEDSFYESGEDIATRIANLVPQVKPDLLASIAIEARTAMKLRHAPLLLAREMARHADCKPVLRYTLNSIIQRADEPAEFLSLYWKDKKQPLAKQARLGLADSFAKFNEYQFAKYNRDGAVKLRDVLFLTHPKPADAAQRRLFKKIADNTLKTPDTWEVELSAGAGEDKKASWTRLLKGDKLGALALLRNLRNMQTAGVNEALISEALSQMKPTRVLPFRFITAARYAPQFEPELEKAMFTCLTEKPQLPGKTALLVDVSGSMEDTVSGKSEIKRIDAAAGLAMLLREISPAVQVLTFSNNVVGVPPRRGFALRDAIVNSQPHGGTHLGAAVALANENIGYDRLIVITDEQSHDRVPDSKGKGYVVNVASYQNGVGYGKWTHIDGWSEAVVDYVAAYEGLGY